MASSEKSAGIAGRWSTKILLLTWVAGCVDAIGYLGLGHVFTANMTGNTVLLGLAIGQGQGLAATRSLSALGGFILGAAVAALLVPHKGAVADAHRVLTGPLLVEGAVLAAFTLLWHLRLQPQGQASLHLMILLCAAAMGIQSVAAQGLSLPGIATTVITVTIANLVTGIVHRLRPAWAAPAGIEVAPRAAGKGQRMKLQAAVFLVYGLAAVASAYSQRRMPALVGAMPLLAIALVLTDAIFSARERNAAQV